MVTLTILHFYKSLTNNKNCNNNYNIIITCKQKPPNQTKPNLKRHSDRHYLNSANQKQKTEKRSYKHIHVNFQASELVA